MTDDVGEHTCDKPEPPERPCRACQRADTKFGFAFTPWLAAGSQQPRGSRRMLDTLSGELDEQGASETAWFTAATIGRLLGTAPAVDRSVWTPKAFGPGWAHVLAEADAILGMLPGEQEGAADRVIALNEGITDPERRRQTHALFASIGGATLNERCNKYERMAYLMLLTGYPSRRVLGNSAQRIAVAKPGVALGAAQLAGLFAVEQPEKAHAALTRLVMEESDGYLLYVLAHAVARPLDVSMSPGIALYDRQGKLLRVGTYAEVHSAAPLEDERARAAMAAMRLAVRLSELGDDDLDHPPFDAFADEVTQHPPLMFGALYTLAALFSEEVLRAVKSREKHDAPG